MNTHEAERIAAAMHAARPDWPARSVLTLIEKNLIDRPRRDVFVALAWVASEPASHTPARVLEAGPWWRAAGVEGETRGPREDPTATRCTICGRTAERHGQTDHQFSQPHEKLDPEVVHSHVAAIRAALVPTSGPTTRKTLADMAEANPELHAKVQAIRDANPGLRADPALMHEPEPEPIPAEQETPMPEPISQPVEAS